MHYKNQLVDNKMCERKLMQNQLDALLKMVEAAEENLETQAAKLETTQHQLWDIRINFSKDINEFLSRHECLIENKNKIKELAKRRKAAKLMKEEIRQLEHSVSSLEAEFRHQKSQLDIIEHLKMDKHVLQNEPENGGEYKRLKNKIEVYQKELDKYSSLKTDEQNFSQYLDPDLFGPQISITSISAAASQELDKKTSTRRVNSESKHSQSVFIMKVPSNIVNKNIK
ncbi:uncharacterized protein LOC106670558 isoform X2 [Cimex lectularius]|nr:uncharacterized protein LOC106670558 isoform X2 [Cimex lectularius]